jgi:phage gpG-like protein
MIGFDFKFALNFGRLLKEVKQAGFRNLNHAAARIRKDAVESIQPGDGPSAPGTPPHTHTQRLTRKGKTRAGQLPRSIVFHVDKAKEEAVIGPRYSMVGEAGAAHEFGGQFRGDNYPERPFMGPALDKNLDNFASDWAGSIGS